MLTFMGPSDDGMMDGGGGFETLFGIVFFLIVVSAIGSAVWKISTARRLAESSGMDKDIATQMALFTDDGLESTYLAANLRGATAPPPPPATVPAPVRERLAVLKGLLDDGLITQAEHDERRWAILDAV